MRSTVAERREAKQLVRSNTERAINSSTYIYLWAIVAWVILALLLPTLLVGMTTKPTLGVNAAISIFFILYSSTTLALECFHSSFEPIRTTFHIFVYSSVGVSALCQQATGLTSFIAEERLRFEANVICLLALVFFEIGHFIGRRRIDPTPREFGRTASRISGDSRLRRLVVFSNIAAILSVTYIGFIGSISVFVSNRQDLNSEASRLGGSGGGEAISGIVTAVGTVPVLLSLAAWLAISKKSLTTTGRRRRTTYVYYLLAVNVIVNNPLTNSRYWFLAVAVTIVYALGWQHFGRLKLLALLGTILAVTVFPFSDVTRYDSQGQVVRVGNNIAEVLSTKDYDQLTMTANTVWYVNEHGFTFGNQILGSVFFWVPRQVWPDKALDTGVTIGQALGAANTNLSSPLWAEVWIDFGFLGLVAAFLLLGFACARFEKNAEYNSWSNQRMVIMSNSIMCFFISGYLLILLRGPLLQAMGRLGIAVLCVGVLHYYVAGRTHLKVAERQVIAK